MKEITSKENIVFEGKVIRVQSDEVILPDGNVATREVVVHRGGVCIVPIDECENVLLVKQFRYPFKQEVLEIPAGKRELVEEPFETARRELSEETGCVAEKYDDLGSFLVTPGYCTEKFYIFLARGLTYYQQHLDEGEFVSVVKMKLDDAIAKVYSNEINDCKTVVGLLLAKKLLDEGK